jgi:hypothetical protein
MVEDVEPKDEDGVDGRGVCGWDGWVGGLGVGFGFTWCGNDSVRRGSGVPSTDGPGAWQHCGDSMLRHIVPHIIGPDFPSVETRQLVRGFQIVMFRSIRVDHTNCLQVAIKTHSSSNCLSGCGLCVCIIFLTGP